MSAIVLPADEKRAESARPATHLFVSRHWDFWLLGGAALLLWLPLYAFAGLLPALDTAAAGLPWVALWLAHAVNHPHFMASYKLAYGQGGGFIRAHWLQLLFVPGALIGALWLAWAHWDTVIADNGLVVSVNRGFAALGWDTRLGNYPSLGPEVLGLLISFMFFTVGWHYAKQTFGCMMVYARFDGYRLAGWQRNVLRYALLSTWWVIWLNANCAVGSYGFEQLQIQRLGLPYGLFIAACVAAGLLFAAVAVVFVMQRREAGRWPSATMLVPMAALLVWHVPLLSHPQYFYMIAFFHSLQYLPFVFKVESTRQRRQHGTRGMWVTLGFFLAFIIAGYLAFRGLPNGLDGHLGTVDTLGASFFLIAFLAFINIHHYFIDNVLWRFSNPQVRNLLLNAG